MGFLLPIIGYAIGGPWGALIGGFLQQILFPPEGPKGPRLNELNVQHSTVGAPVPIVYGTAALAGNVIWSGGLIETKHEDEQGGKFGIGGTEVTSYTYSVDLAIGICEGPISGIRRIWADADLIYDASDDATLFRRLFDESGELDPEVAEEMLQQFIDVLFGIRAMSAQLNFELYLGTEDQLPDPTIESYEPAGTVPGFRGLAYIVFNDFQLEKYGNRIPNFRFEVYSGTPTECGLYSAGQLYPWLFDPASAAANPLEYNPNTNDPRNPLNNHLYANCISSLTAPGDSLATAKASMSAAFSGRVFLIDDAVGPDIGDNIFIQGWSKSSTPNAIRPCDDYDAIQLPFADYVTVALNLNSLHIRPMERYDCLYLGAPPYPGDCSTELEYAAVGVHSGQFSGFRALTNDNDSAAAAGLFEGVTTTQGVDANGDCLKPEPIQKWRLLDQQMCVARSIQPASPCALGTPLAGAPGWCVFNGQIAQDITWTEVAGTFKALQKYDDTGGVPGIVITYPVNPCLRSDDLNYNNQAYWEAAYANALADGEPIAAGLTYGVDYPETQSFAYFSECDTVDAECVPMAIIVADICRRAGLRTDTSTQIDVSGLTTCVPGYIIGRQMSARDALGPLRMFGLWDATESQGLLRFVERGAAIVETLTADDLGAHENGSQAPTAVEVSRVQEKDLPRRLRLHFANFLHDHESSEQSASRISTEAIDEIDVELPISMEPDTAAQLADIMLYETWFGRSTFRFSLDNSRLALEPTDCVEIPVDNETRRVRIVAVDYKIGGLLQVDAVADDDGSYVSTAVADPSAPSGGVPGGPGSGPICPSGLVLLDLPCLQDSHSGDAGYYAAIYSTCPAADSWACAELYRSNDGGVTFGRVARTNDETTVGVIDDITGPATDPTLPGDSPAYDDSNSITVSLYEGELASITDAQIDAGQNLAAIGSDGAWVIIQFKTATLSTESTYVLTDLIWGLNDTQHLLGTTTAGDTFVLLSDSALLRIPESPDNIGVEKQFKAVTCGEAVDAVTAVSFTPWGLCYQRLCPATVLSCSTTSPPTGAVDGDAYYLPNDTSLTGVWETHGGEIATWSGETDSWVFCTPAAGTIVHCDDEDVDVIPPGGGGDPTPAPWARSDATFATQADESATLPNSYRLVEGDNINFEYDTGGTGGNTLTIHGAAGGGTGDTSGPIALDDLTDVAIGSPLAEGDLLVYRGTEGWVNEPIETAISGGGGMSFVGEYEVTGASQQNLTVSGLDLDADECYFVMLTLDNDSGGTANISLYYNADTTATNYDRQRIAAVSTTISGNRANTALLFEIAISTAGYLKGYIRRDPGDAVRFLWEGTRNDAGSIDWYSGTHAWRTGATNVTSMTMRGDVANTFGNGSTLTVWKLTTGGGGGGGGGGSYSPPVTTKGDLFTFDTDDARLAVGTNGDTVIADSTTATGLKWGVPGIPSNAQAGNYTIVANDNGRSIDHASGAGAGDTYTIPANGTLALPLGFTFSVSNMDSNALTVAITTDTLRKAGTGSTGSVSVAQYGTATFRKVATTEWLWTGVGAT